MNEMTKNLPQTGALMAINVCNKRNMCPRDVNECVSTTLNLGSISPNCKSCFLGFSMCIVKECSEACLKEHRDPNECEKCAKGTKCSFNECNSHNYLPYKHELKGKSLR